MGILPCCGLFMFTTFRLRSLACDSSFLQLAESSLLFRFRLFRNYSNLVKQVSAPLSPFHTHTYAHPYTIHIEHNLLSWVFLFYHHIIRNYQNFNEVPDFRLVPGTSHMCCPATPCPFANFIRLYGCLQERSNALYCRTETSGALSCLAS